MLDMDDGNFTNDNSSLYVQSVDDKDVVRKVNKEDLDPLLNTEIKIPNILYSPEAIFSGDVAALDINFINPHEYEAVELDSNGAVTPESQEKAETAAGKIAPTIAKWYVGFRNIAIVGLLSVLVYLGIRILIGSTAADKAKYKERLFDWFVALCLVFIVHIIMAGVLLITEKVKV